MTAAAHLLEPLAPDLSVYIPGASGESPALAEALAADPARARGVRFAGCLVPGMNGFDYAALHPETRLETFLMPPATRASFEAGRVALRPLAYSQIAEHFAARDPFDVAYLQVAPPGPDGLCSLGIASDFGPIVWPKARRRVLMVNARMPAMPRGPRVALSEAHDVVEIDAPLVVGDAAPDSAETRTIAAAVAALVPDGAAIQFGIGGAPAAILERLTDRRDLVIRSGMVIDGVERLWRAGALDPRGGHVTGVALGSDAFYAFLAESDLVAFSDTFETHGPAALARIERFISINSALEIDLFGQANLEWRGGRVVSGVGGAPDFVRAARRSPGGRSVIALPATAGGGRISRITLKLDAPTVSIPRNDIDTVVTEHGAAHLRDLDLDARAEALIAVAAPAFRADLTAGWRDLRRSL